MSLQSSVISHQYFSKNAAWITPKPHGECPKENPEPKTENGERSEPPYRILRTDNLRAQLA